MDIDGVEVEDTYCEAFEGLYSRLIITAIDSMNLQKASNEVTALPYTVFGESEGGIESYVSKDSTPDNREGAVIQLWTGNGDVEKLYTEVSKRIRQGVLVVPGTRVFNASNGNIKIDTMEKIGHCGDGYEWIVNRFGREMINIPIMMGDFLVEKEIRASKGIMGGNVWFFCDNIGTALDAGKKALEKIKGIEGVITPFDICAAGSKVETNYPEIGPTTNHVYCPTLRYKIDNSKVPEETESIPEIVINGVDKEAVEEAMKVAIFEASKVDGVSKITSGNFGGRLGDYKIFLKDLVD